MGSGVQKIWAEHALAGGVWRAGVQVTIGDDGRIEAISGTRDSDALRVGVLLPAPANLHSHAIQRAMAGLTEARAADTRDSFWTWRALMYRFLDTVGPDDLEAIAALGQMEMLEAGYACVGEFHYIHHAPDGTPYDDLAELAGRIAAAADQSGIGLTLLPVLYQQAGCDGSQLGRGQVRFGNSSARFAALFERSAQIVERLGPDAGIGVAPHSLRAVNRDGLADCLTLAPDRPVHIHIAEQTGEVDEVVAHYGQRPVDWLMDAHEVDERWCLVHATHMTAAETARLARSGAVAGLCPVTEASLGDGIFDGADYLAQGGRFGIGTDSNIRISLSEELRLLEYSQRLRDKGRAILASRESSTGRTLFEGALRGGAQTTGRESGSLAQGEWADLLALNSQSLDLDGRQGDTLLDSFVFAHGDGAVSDVWSAGRHMVREGRHVHRDAIVSRYRAALRSLRERA